MQFFLTSQHVRRWQRTIDALRALRAVPTGSQVRGWTDLTPRNMLALQVQPNVQVKGGWPEWHECKR